MLVGTGERTSSDLMVIAAPGVGQLGDALVPRYRGVLSSRTYYMVVVV
jgi:hypothetical protein